MTPVLQLKNIRKSFGGVTAIQDFSLDLHAGEVVALVGDNGAGKSTLIKMISGVHPPSSGEILLDGQPASFADASVARERGIEVVYQDLALADQQTVYMNLFLGREPVKGPLRILDRKRMIAETETLVKELDVRIPSASATIRDLSGGQRQGVAIARATHWAKKLVLLDEPTAALGVAETARVEATIEALKARKLAIFIISHSLDQVFRLSDRICVLRRGQQIGIRETAKTDKNENLSSRIEISTRVNCLDVEGATQVHFLGLEFVRAAGEELGHGSAVNCTLGEPNARAARNITFVDCRIGETLSSASRGEGAVFLRGLKGLALKNVTVENVRGAFGLALHDCVDVDLRNLHLRGISQSAARFFGVRNCIFAFSHIEDSAREAHANKFNFYEGSDTVLVYGVRTRNTGGYVTYQKASRLYFGFSEFDATADGTDNRALVSQNYPSGSGRGGADGSGAPEQGGTFWYWNLDLVPRPNHGPPPRALLVGPGRSTQSHRIHNCRLYGGGVPDVYLRGANPDIETRSHNIYTGLSYWQSARYLWSFGDHEASATSAVLPTGMDLSAEISASIAPYFPNFSDWDRDIDFNVIDWLVAPIGARRP